jgi:rhodanese-related sulfurtransferase
LSSKYNQATFVEKIKKENFERLDDEGTDFNYPDLGYSTTIPHAVRINKRPITAKPQEKFGTFSESLFGLTGKQDGTLKSILSLEN